MKKYARMLLLALCISFTVLPVQQANAAQIPIVEIIKAGIKKVIKAVDLKIQRLQNKTLWLQNAQKTLENTLSKLKLDEISEWTEKQKEQYREYYEELAKVKAIISYYQRIRDITQKQVRLVNEYQHAWQLIQQDEHFTSNEIEYISRVYSGILEESLNNIDQITLIVQSFTTTMSDAKRLDIINNAADQVDANYDDLMRFNQQNVLLSLSRAKTSIEVQTVKKLYGLP
jgi:predicted transcriptional regulator YheO